MFETHYTKSRRSSEKGIYNNTVLFSRSPVFPSYCAVQRFGIEININFFFFFLLVPGKYEYSYRLPPPGSHALLSPPSRL